VTLDLRSELRRYGAADAALKLLDGPRDAEALRYVDLFPESLARKDLQGMPAPAGVVEHEDRPLLYVYRDNALAIEPGAATVPELVRSLACRGEGHFLAIVRPGELEVYPVGLLAEAPSAQIIRADSPRAPLLIADLVSGREFSRARQQLAAATSLHDLLFELITSVAQELRGSSALSVDPATDEVLPLVGRAIFTRFLIDRGIINQQTFPALYATGKPEDAFATAASAARTFAWLDATFNGELLPLLFDCPHPRVEDYERFFSRPAIVAGGVLHQLTNVMCRAPNGRLALSLAWEGVDFAHVPVGLLSEVYEDYAHQFYRDAALRESVRYTPRHLAEFTVAQAFNGLPQAERASARVLDPAAGAGIFLVLSFQQLVREQWRATGLRPDTATIRAILNTQIRGYDINSSALTLAALSLYLTALEVDPDPFPPDKLRFDRLLGRVLRNVRDPSAPRDALVLGSLGPGGDPAPGEEPFSIVTGNPPWTSFAQWRDGERNFNDYAADMARDMLARHRASSASLQAIGAAYVHNDHLPDTAFLWRTLQWAKPNGVVAFIVAGRLLFKRGEGGSRVRAALFQSLHVTGILNGALLLPLWPQVNQPFCIIFARNREAPPDARFTLVTPIIDRGPDEQPRMRVDAEARQPMALTTALERPYLFKALTRGGRLDVDIVERILALSKPADGGLEAPSRTLPIVDFWSGSWTGGQRRHGQGFIPIGPRTNKVTARTRERLAKLIAQNAAVLTSQDTVDRFGSLRIGLRILPQQVSRLDTRDLYRLAEPSIFQPPLVVIREGFGSGGQDEPRARLYQGRAPLVVNRSFYAFSCAGHPNATRLAKLLFCIVNSDLFGYYTLVHSAKFGLERRTLLVEDVADFPMPCALLDRQLEAVEQVADAMSMDDPATWRTMNRCINQLYGLTPADEQVIQDTLATRMPYKQAQEHAAAPATTREREGFRKRLEGVLQPFFKPDGETISVQATTTNLGGWVAFDIVQGQAAASQHDDGILQLAAALADDEGASRVFFASVPGKLRVAIRNQYRYLTVSQARLCALDVLREHADAFPLLESAA
jgi:hypothetical protein